MPDAGDFERDQRDTRMGWGEAFAALPQEAPDAGGWQRVQARLPAPARTRTRWPLWLATAASLLLALAIPFVDRHSRESGNPASLASSNHLPAPGTRSIGGSDDTSTAPAGIASERKTLDSRFRGNDEQKPIAASRNTARRVPPSQSPIRTAVKPAAASIAATDTTAPDFEPLYAQSAQLESLLALARDERVASGTSAALSDELDAQVAAIDAALIQPGLDPQRRADLWGQRVDALRQLVGIEATNRLYAARGQSYDAALVSID